MNLSGYRAHCQDIPKDDKKNSPQTREMCGERGEQSPENPLAIRKSPGTLPHRG